MATRRSRIKGIANIPQRRKVENKPVEAPSVLPKSEDDTEAKSPVIAVETPPSSDSITEKVSIPLEPAAVPPEQTKTINQAENAPTSEETEIKPPIQPTKPATPVVLPRRRTFIKPAVNAKLLSQRPKPKLDTIKLDEPKTETISVPDPVIEPSSSVVQDISQNDNLPPPIPIQASPIRSVISTQSKGVKSGSDTEYSAEPLSPTKLVNRSRIKAVPRLGHRRTSVTVHGSASESEDDTKKIKRIRTESACSVASIGESQRIDPGFSPQKSKEFSTIIQRKCKRTEQSRKMAEARRHFLHKFGNKTPDKQKLTMIDLIFYNPLTNPMSQKPKKSQTKPMEEEILPESPEKQEPDDIHSDEENTIPAPQIKIGANGEILIDEQSLVIENAQTKRERAELQKSELVDGDFDTSYGIYKREKRSKDWSKEETLRFYKALNTLGTDFTLMVPLFAGRSRRELKMKFKKEERVNRSLVDKALTQPMEFNITELQEEVDNLKRKTEEEQALKAKQAEEWVASKKNAVIPYTYSGIKKKPTKNKGLKRPKQRRQPPPDLYDKLEKGITSMWNSDSGEESDSKSTDQDFQNILRPTRCGRIPKPRKVFNYTATTSTSVEKQEPQSSNNMQDLNGLQPGSLMIVYSQTPTGQPAFKVFMVTPSQNKVPITLTPDMLSNLTQSVNKPNVEEELPPENNYTIAHDEETDLKKISEENVELPKENIVISTESVEQQLCPYEQPNLSVPVENNITLTEENVTLCSDGKYDVNLKS